MSQTFTDPTSGRPYVVDPATGQTQWVDQAPPPPSPPGSGVPVAVSHLPAPGEPTRKPKTVAGIVGLIVAAVALTISWVPIINNVAFFFALLSGGLATVGLVATRRSGKRSGRWVAASAMVTTVLVVVVVISTQALFSKAVDEVGKSLESVGPVAPAASGAGAPKDVAQFGSVVTFKDGSTLTCTKPAPFKRAEFAAGAEDAKALLKSQCTFVNRSEKTFQPTGTTGSMTASGVEGESVYQEGLDAPDNPVLPGKSVSWWMGYGVQSTTDVQLTVSLGFLDYDAVTFH